MNGDTYPKGGNLGFDRLDAGPGIPQSHKVQEQAPEGLVSKQERRTMRLEMVGKMLPSKVGQFERAYSGRSMKPNGNSEPESENLLDLIERWPVDSFGDLLRFLGDALEEDGRIEIEFKDWGNRFFVDDGGVKSNADLIAALRRNRPLWKGHWRCSSLIGTQGRGRAIRHEFHLVNRN